MKTILIPTVAAFLFLNMGFAYGEAEQSQMNINSGQNQNQNQVELETLGDIKSTLGIIPEFLSRFPREALPAAWQEFKAINLSQSGKLKPQEKELISIAVASIIPCKYCIYFHTVAAKQNGATDEQIAEAIANAAIQRRWVMVINGDGQSYENFKTEMVRSMKGIEQSQPSQQSQQGQQTGQTGQNQHQTLPSLRTFQIFETPEAAIEDIKATFGFVPRYLLAYPHYALPGAWLETKQLILSDETHLSPRLKHLIGLAVSTQTQSKHARFFHLELAKAASVSAEEIREATASAALTGHWSTMLNGLQINEERFKKDVTDIMAFIQQSH